jgi:hypothetical protein
MGVPRWCVAEKSVKAAWRLPRQRSVLAPRPANVHREGESAIVVASGFGSPTEPLGSPSNLLPDHGAHASSGQTRYLHCTRDNILTKFAHIQPPGARCNWQVAKKPLATRLWARGCGGPELYGKVISRQTSDNSTTTGLMSCSRECGSTPGSTWWSILPDDRRASRLPCCLVVFISFRLTISNSVMSRGSHVLQQCYSLSHVVAITLALSHCM